MDQGWVSNCGNYANSKADPLSMWRASWMSLGLSGARSSAPESGLNKVLHLPAREFQFRSIYCCATPSTRRAKAAAALLARAMHRFIDLSEKGISKEMYTPPACSSMDPCRATIEPGVPPATSFS